jgi:2',3'-cyclic-nucleotide 2'-phosphodiesterase (5'-nucleotidase family)
MRILAAFHLLLALAANAAAGIVAVYHTSDVHGWYSSRPAKWDPQNSTRPAGGFAALYNLLKAEKHPYLLLDSGDMFQGTPEGNYSRGMASVELMNKLGYAAAVAGNHDFDYGEESLRKMNSAAVFSFLGANVTVRETGKHPDYLKPYVIVEKGGQRIAILGLAGKHTATSTLPSNVKHLLFSDEAVEAARWMKEIQARRPDAVVVLAHTGLGSYAGSKIDLSTATVADSGFGTLPIARAVPGAAVVLGGHNHTGLLKGYRDGTSGVLLGESFWSLTDVTRVELRFDDATGKFTGASAELRPVWADTLGEDPEVLEIIKKYRAAADVEMEKPVGESRVDLPAAKDGSDFPVGNWFADAMLRQSGAELAFQNSAGIRADLRKGLIKMRDIYQVMPFENTLVKLTMTGEQVRRLLEDNVSNGRSRLQVAGLRLKIGPGDKLEIEAAGKPLDDQRKYTVATNNYLTTGGNGGEVFAEALSSEDTLLPLRDLLVKDLRENPVKALPDAGRIIRTK